jgi:hypothetical protein
VIVNTPTCGAPSKGEFRQRMFTGSKVNTDLLQEAITILAMGEYAKAKVAV